MMNRLAVVLAADSASTVSGWNQGKPEERYFKGANKVFQLSNYQPVGLMIFDSADILRVPWELIIKAFRAALGKKSFNTTEEYASELFEFIEAHQQNFFPKEIQDGAVLNAAQNVIFSWIIPAIEDVEPADRADRTQTALSHAIGAGSNLETAACVGEDAAKKTVADLSSPLAATIRSILDAMQIKHSDNIDKAAEIALRQVLSQPDSYLGTTGLVFAGFGDHEIFPAMVEYVSCGVVAGRPIHIQRENLAINHDNPAWLSGFAQTSMTDTFYRGLSYDVYSSLMLTIDEHLQDLVKEAANASGGNYAAIDDINSLVQATAGKIGAGVLEKAMQEHSLPLKNVLKFLPVEEMAELAETLITLQSLKEKMTKPSETVGGPVDVAIITKHEGLVWIRRKHFFNPDINSRYALRQSAQLT
jgi:hypothetical protein